MVRRAPLVLLAALVAACADDPEPPMRTALGPPQGSGISFQAVDAGTGAALANPAMTVRYLVRSPITVDAAGVEEVPSTEPFAIREEVADDSLVVEVRLEAASYHRLDTVLAVVRGPMRDPSRAA